MSRWAIRGALRLRGETCALCKKRLRGGFGTQAVLRLNGRSEYQDDKAVVHGSCLARQMKLIEEKWGLPFFEIASEHRTIEPVFPNYLEKEDA